jgi:hypothetical protein
MTATTDYGNYETNFSKFHNPSEHLAVDEVIVKFKGRLIFKQCITKKKKFGIKMYKLCDSTGYTYDIDVYLGKDRRQMTQHLIATHYTVTDMARRVEGAGYKLHGQHLFLP